MENKYALILGGNKLNLGVEQKIKSMGLICIVVDWNKSPDIRGDIHLQLDIKHASDIVDELRKRNIETIEFAYTSTDYASETVQKLHKNYGLNHFDYNKYGLNSFDKYKMTSIWQSNGILNRGLYESEAYEKIVDEGIPLIVKPRRSSSSRGISIIDSPNVHKLIVAVEEARKSCLVGEAIVEEFFEGTEYTVEMLIDKLGNVSVYGISQKYHSPYIVNNKIATKLLFNPLGLNDFDYDKIAKHAIKCVETLGFHSCFAHMELLVNADGVVSPVEVGSRSSGFIASDLVDVSSGRNFLGDYRDIIHGATLTEPVIPRTEVSSCYFFYDFPIGTFLEDFSPVVEYLVGANSLYFDRKILQESASFQQVNNDNERLGYEIIGFSNRVNIESVLNAEKNYKVTKKC